MKVNLDDVVNAIESVNDEYPYYYSVKEERIVMMAPSESDQYEEDDLIRLPDRRDVDDYGNMERFIERVEDDNIREWLSNAIRGRGAFRMFRAALERFHMLNEWYDYRDRAHRVLAMDWCEENGIEYEGSRYVTEEDYYDDDEDDDYEEEPVIITHRTPEKPAYKVIPVGRKNVNQLVFLASDFTDERRVNRGEKKLKDPDAAGAHLEEALANGADIFAMSDHGRYVGYVIAYEEEKRFVIPEIYVRKELRRQNLGRMLVQQCESIAEEEGKELQFDVQPDDEDTIAFLRRCDYLVLAKVVFAKAEEGESYAETFLGGEQFLVR